MNDRARRRRGVDVLVAVLRDLARLERLSAEECEALLPAAEAARLLSRLAIDAERMRLTTSLPLWARDRLTSARVRGQAFERAVLWEVDRVHRALLPVGVRPVFLKGAGYIAAGLSCGVGRVVADVDILVSEADLPVAQAALQEHGWRFESLHAYDERYYREWMHELPPMRHRGRGTMLDVHHRILPRTGRVHPPTERLLEKAVDVGGTRVLAPAHMVLHSAAHLFQDGEVAGAIRDLHDFHDLVGHFGRQPQFWNALVNDAGAFGLERAMYYALRSAQRVWDTDISEAGVLALKRWRPNVVTQQIMDSFIAVALRQPAGQLRSPSVLGLYLRSHWLRMPLPLLATHLIEKARRAIVRGEPVHGDISRRNG